MATCKACTAVTALFAVICVLYVTESFPLHASCKVSWTFGIPCSSVKDKLVNQMKKWQTEENCKDGGEKCLYTVVSESDTKITGKHETPKKHYVDDLTFTLTSDGSKCNMQGYSTSETWYAVLDYGTNYCNMENLISGSGLDQVAGYSETTSDSICTQRSKANCEVY